jgi:hypothetical protein
MRSSLLGTGYGGEKCGSPHYLQFRKLPSTLENGCHVRIRFGMLRLTCDPNVWTGGVLQEENLETAALGLAPMYPAYLWSVCNAPGHHEYERAFDLISGEASTG